MSKKSFRAKKSPEPAAQPIGPKPLTITPQIAVSIQGNFPDQELFVEQPNGSGTRHKVKLTPANAYKILMDLLMEKAGGIELERQLAEERRNKSANRIGKQPNWRLIAKHPEAEIREGLVPAALCAKGSITVIPTRAKELLSNTADKSLEDMGL